jgi:hypothetical protein
VVEGRGEAMARKAAKTEIITPEKMGDMMKALYPIRSGKNGFARFRYDFVFPPSGVDGMCIFPRKDGKGIKRTLALYAKLSNRPYQKVLEEVVGRNTVLLIVDPTVYEECNWNCFLLVAIHEYAHYLHGTAGSVYTLDLRENFFERNLGLLEEFNHRVYGTRGYKKVGPLFGDWCLWGGTYDRWSHDPLYYFILYFLERKAHEMGYFTRKARPVYDDGP